MFGMSIVNDAAGAFFAVMSVMADPGFAEDFLTEAARPRLFRSPMILGIRAIEIPSVVEGVC